MGNYELLKAAINEVIKANGRQEITGEVLNQVLLSMVNSLGAGYQCMGVATPSTNPGTPDQNVFYFATQAGTYTNFDAIVLQAGISVLIWDGDWASQTWLAVDSAPTNNSQNLIASGAVFNAIKLDGGAYDVSAHNSGATFASLSELLNSANLNTLIPTEIRHGGMSIKYVQSSDNKYAQYRLMTQTFSTIEDDWCNDEESINSIIKVEGEYLSLSLSDGVYQSGIIPVKENDYIEFSVFWDSTLADVFRFSENADMSGAEFVRNGRVNKMTNGVFSVPKNGYIYARSLSSGAPETPYVRIITKKNEIFDISEYNASGTPLVPATYASLNLALAAIPNFKKEGGMTIRYIDSSSSNKYVQYRLMSKTFNTTVANWQGVDDESTAGSDNLITSGAVDKVINGNLVAQDITSYFQSEKDIDGSPNSACASVIITKLPSRAFQIKAHLYSSTTYGGVETAGIWFFDENGVELGWKLVTQHNAWEDIVFNISEYPTAVYYAVRTSNTNYQSAVAFVLVRDSGSIKENLSFLNGEINGETAVIDLTSDFEYHKAWDGSANSGFSSISIREIPTGANKISAKLYADMFFQSQNIAYIAIYDKNKDVLLEQTVPHLKEWNVVSVDLTEYPGARYYAIVTYSENYQYASAQYSKSNVGIAGELQELQERMDEYHPALEKEITLILETEKTITPDGGVMSGSNKQTTQWLFGPGVYKVVRTDIDMETRFFPFDVCFSPDGNVGTKTVAIKECYHRYICVPHDKPYFRLTYYSSSADLCKLFKMRDFKDGIVNVKDFGAKGDGSSDDTYAIQDAIDFITYGAGGTVYIPNGKFILNTIQEFDNRKANLIIPAFLHGNMEPLLNEYDSTKTYYVDSRVTYNGDKYYCTENGVTGAWDSSKWRAFSLDSRRNMVNIVGNGRFLVYNNFIASYKENLSDLNVGSMLCSTVDSDINNGLSSPVSVLACGYSTKASFLNNYFVTVALKGFVIKTDNRHGYSRLCGIDMSHSPFTTIDNVTVYSAEDINEIFSGENGYLQESGHVSVGVMMPKFFCDPGTYAHGVAVAKAFTIGFVVGDCQQLNNCWAGNCMYGYALCQSSHPAMGEYMYCFNSNIAVSVVSQVLYDRLKDTYDEWESSTSYAVGDYVCYNYQLYKCKTAHTSGDSFDSSKWDRPNLLTDYADGGCWLVVNLLSCELATGIQPRAFNMQYVCKDQANYIHGKITYLNADHPSVGIPILGGGNVTFEDLGN